MKKLFLSGVLFPAFMFLFASNGVLINQGNVLNDRVISQINVISSEVYEKTGVFLGVSISDDNDFKNLFDTSKQLVKDYEKYAVIVLDSSSKRISILNSKNMDDVISKDKLLNFYYLKWGFFPTQGAILPLISSPKAQDPYNAGILNGFGEMSFEVAEKFNIILDNAFANTNQNFLNSIRMIFYAVVIIVLGVMIKRKFTRKKVETK